VAGRRKLKPGVLLRRKALRSGVFGGDSKWFRVFLVITAWRKAKGLFGFGDPEPVYVHDVEPGQSFVIAHQPSTSRRKRRKARKSENKAAKKADKTLAKATKKAQKKTDKRDKKATKNLAKSRSTST